MIENNWSNKVVVITGSSSGIGYDAAERFAQAGATLVLGARNIEKLQDIALEFEKKYKITCFAFSLDVRKKESCEKFIADAIHHAKKIDILLNNAGLALALDHITEYKEEDAQQMVETNILGLLRITKFVVPHMIKAHTGHIINIGSTAGYGGYEGGSVYCGTKYAVRGISEGIREDVLGKNIRVTNISPGMTETKFSVVRFKGDEEKAKKVYEGVTPLTGKDIAEIIFFTASMPAHVNIDEIIVRPVQQSRLKVHRNVK